MTTPTVGDSLWLRRFHTTPDSPVTLVCFPHAGGSASFYHPVSAALHGRVQVLALQYPGRQDRRRDPCLTSIAELAEATYTALRPLTGGPVAFFGHSMGATLAFEVANRMGARQGATPVALFVSGRRAPSRHRDEQVHKRSDDGLVRDMKALSGTDTRLLGDAELMRAILPAIRADYTAAETYRWSPGPKLDCPIVALVGDDDPKVDIGEVESWAEHTTAGFDLHVYPGGHFYVVNHQPAILRLLAGTLLGEAC